MGIITRYLMLEVLKIFLVSLTAMTFLMLLVGVAIEARLQGLDAAAILRLIPYVLPNALCFAIPGTILFSVCSVYGRMSASNEVVALKSLGVSPMAITWPTLVLSFILSLVTVWLNDVAVSWGREGMYTVALESAERTVYSMLRARRSYSNSQISIHVQAVEGDTLIRPTLAIGGNGGPPLTMVSQTARLTSRPEDGVLIFSATNGEIDDGKVTVQFDDRIDQEIPLADVMRRSKSVTSPSNLALRVIPSELQSQNESIEQQEQKMAAKAAFELLGGNFESLVSNRWKTDQAQLEQSKERKYRLLTEPWRRWANGFSCLMFVVVGLPLAVRMRSADVWTTFALCFIPILLAYYPLLAFGLSAAKNGTLPPFAVWISNLATLVVGLIIFRKVIRY